MPNWVTNKVMMPWEAMEQCLSTDTEEGKDYFDFNKIIPRPKIIDIKFNGGTERVAKEIVRLKKEGKAYAMMLVGLNNEEKDLVHQMIKCHEETGYLHWYDWCVGNWGTKWNTAEPMKIEGDTVSFDTAWNAPLPVLKKASEIHQCRIVHWWADEDTGYNVGQSIFENGKEVCVLDLSCTRVGYELAFILTGNRDSFKFNEETGEYEMKEVSE